MIVFSFHVNLYFMALVQLMAFNLALFSQLFALLLWVVITAS